MTAIFKPVFYKKYRRTEQKAFAQNRCKNAGLDDFIQSGVLQTEDIILF
jgi:hypothetical protein